jgi:hypothetical protein
MPPSLRRFSPDFIILAVAPSGRVSDSPSPPPQASSRGHGRLASPHTETSPYAALGICVHEVNSVRVSCLLLLCPPSPPVLLLACTPYLLLHSLPGCPSCLPSPLLSCLLSVAPSLLPRHLCFFCSKVSRAVQVYYLFSCSLSLALARWYACHQVTAGQSPRRLLFTARSRSMVAGWTPAGV